MGGQVFEMKPELYLHQADKRCQFAVAEN